ncbi:MAG TPA: HIT domain-containing protein [Candidatus Thermoplasmatota archaeon]|nr:HIT domain-containing protein [Candidatus Thermoplasmatota archaeon]
MIPAELSRKAKTSPMVQDCPFCSIDEQKTAIVEKREAVYVALSNPRLVRGHLLVIPRRHVEKLAELTQEELTVLWDTVVEFQEKILTSFSTGCDVRQNYRPFQRQSRVKVDHLHVHLIPREFKDQIYQVTQIYETQLFEDLEEEEKRDVLLLLRMR